MQNLNSIALYHHNSHHHHHHHQANIELGHLLVRYGHTFL